ncbi:MAG: DUF6483 family protein [Persicimonas sp.]
MTDWREQELKTARQLVARGSKALQNGRGARARHALNEARAVLEMSAERPDEKLKLQAQLLNELGVLAQREDDTERAREHHEESLRVCEELIDRDVDFHSNAAATHLNLSSMIAAGGDLVEATRHNERALELIDKALAGGDDSAASLAVGAHQNMALLLARSERFERAEEELDTTVELAVERAEAGDARSLPQAAQACQRLSVMLFEAGKHERALTLGRRAEQLAEDAYEALGSEVLSVYVISQINLISYNEKLGRFADAEDALWKGLDVSGNHPDVLKRGLAFYEHLRKQADGRLEKGDLPRDEVEEGLADLERRIDEVGGLDD